VLLSLGKFLPLYNLLYEIPVLRWFRYPAKFLHAAILPLALLTGWSIQRFKGNAEPRKRLMLSLFFFSLLLVLLAIFFSTSRRISSMLENYLFAQTNDTITKGLIRSFCHLGIVSTLTAAGCLLVFKKPRLVWILVAMLTVDLVLAGRAVNPYLPRSLFLNEPRAANMVKQHLQGGRFYRPESKHVKLIAASDDISNGIQWDLQTLNWYTAAYYGIPLMYNASFETLESAEILQLKLLAANLSWDKRNKLLSTANVSLALTAESLSPPAWKRIGVVKSNSQTDFYLYENQYAAPRVGIFDSGAVARSTPQALKILFHPSFDPRRHVVLESPGLHPRPCNEKRVYNLKTVNETTSTSSYISETACDAYLATAIPYYDGWKVQIDGKPAPLIRANAAFFAVFLPAGKHLVTLNYFPNSIFAGSVVSILFLLSLPFAASLATKS
jgi:hypothetical protein